MISFSEADDSKLILRHARVGADGACEVVVGDSFIPFAQAWISSELHLAITRKVSKTYKGGTACCQDPFMGRIVNLTFRAIIVVWVNGFMLAESKTVTQKKSAHTALMLKFMRSCDEFHFVNRFEQRPNVCDKFTVKPLANFDELDIMGLELSKLDGC